MADLFTEERVREYDDPEHGHVIELPDTVEGRIAVFLNRWAWRGQDLAFIAAELRHLIEFAKTKD